jgi:DNA-directed RNA polymerase specialized sigma24 family protein
MRSENQQELESVATKLDGVVARLDALIRLQVFAMTENKNQMERIRLFAMAGLTPKQISKVLDTTANSIRVALSNYRKKSKQRLRIRRSDEKE